MPKLIDADKLKAYLQKNSVNHTLADIDAQPTVDAEPVVRCKDCKYYQEGFRGEHWCTKHSNAYSIMQWGVKEDDYCSWGERREDAETNK